jgi:predicted ATPase
MLIVFLDRYHAWPEGVEPQYPCIKLRRNTWNDYGFETLFNADFCPSEDDESWTSLGAVKIGRRGYAASEPGMRKILSGAMTTLGDDWFSLGQSRHFYEILGEQTLILRNAYAQAMRDIPMLQLAVDELEIEEIYRVSLLRSSGALEALDYARDQFGIAVALEESFEFRTRIAPSGDHAVNFDFSLQGGLPHRINVLVGVNGVGKTQLMARLAIALGRYEEKDVAKEREAKGESFEVVGTLKPRPSFYGVIAVSFSAFDDFAVPRAADTNALQYAYCGIRRPKGGLYSEKQLARRIPSLLRKMPPERQDLFAAALEQLLPSVRRELPTGHAFYNQLSAGQRIVLNIVSELILHLEPRSLVLLDEPETHLHPQLLATLMSVINVILQELDCYAIVATHSPIVVQQVLARHVHIVQRADPAPPVVRNPPSETFGENLSEIVRLVFDSVESDRDYHNVLDELLDANDRDPERVRALFEGRLGLNASIYLDSLAYQEEAN